MHHVFLTGTPTVRAMLYKVRQTWNLVFPVNILKDLDEKVRQIDAHWPYLAHQRKMIDQIKAIENQIKSMQKEVFALEMAALVDTSTNTYINIENEIDSGQQISIHSASQNKRKLLTIEMPKKMKKTCADIISPRSSVLLTPSPEPRTPTEQSDHSDTSSSFWSFLNKKTESEKSISPIENVEIPFLFGSPKKCIKLPKIESIECTQQLEGTFDNTNVNSHQIHTKIDVKEEEAQKFELHLSFDNTPETCTNFEMYDETLTTINEIEVPEIIDEISCSSEPKALSPKTISIDGIIEFEAIAPEPLKPIKINLLNPIVVEESNSKSVELSKTLATNEMVQNKTNEWKTPSISYDVKDSMKNATFHVKPICRGGIERSGLCSIM